MGSSTLVTVGDDGRGGSGDGAATGTCRVVNPELVAVVAMVKTI